MSQWRIPVKAHNPSDQRLYRRFPANTLTRAYSKKVSSSIFPPRRLGDGSLQESDRVFARPGAVMAKKYSSILPQDRSPFRPREAEIHRSLESAYFSGIVLSVFVASI